MPANPTPQRLTQMFKQRRARGDHAPKAHTGEIAPNHHTQTRNPHQAPWASAKKTRIGLYVITLCLSCLSTISTSQAATIKVGPKHAIKLPSQAATLVQAGDIVEIEAGIYPGDAAVWRADNLTLRGVNGRARLLSQGITVGGKGIWVIKGRNTTVENIEFANAKVPDRNGAGIRQEGANLTVRNCLFRENENGILSGANPESEITIESSEFDHNGQGDGRSHNIYIGAIRKFTLRNSTTQRARIGHQIKSRASINIIENNIIQDSPTGHSSYLIDLPSGGTAIIKGNTLHQGKYAENYTMLAYGAEKMLHKENSISIIDNKFSNDRRAGCRAIWIKPSNVKPELKNNQFIDCKQIMNNEG